MLDGRSDSAPAGAGDIYDSSAASGWDNTPTAGTADVSDDDIPF